MDDRDHRQAPKTEPSLYAEGPADAPAMQPPYPETREIPDWTEEPFSAPEGGDFLRAVKFWGGSLATLALLFLVSLWLFDEHGGRSSMAVPSVSSAMPAVKKVPESLPLTARVGNVPPLVLLAPAPVPAAAPQQPVLAKLPPKTAPVKVAVKTPAAKTSSAKAPAAKPMLAKAPGKPVAQAPRKVALARSVPVQAKAKPVLVAAKKPVALARRAPAATQAKPKLLAQASLPPARARAPERSTEAAAPRAQSAAAPRTQSGAGKCLPGELARECAARLQ